MNTVSLPRPLARHRHPLQHAWLRFNDAMRVLLRAQLDQRAQRRAMRIERDVERELLSLDPRTLNDIGAPQGLVGQRRWHDEQEAWNVDRMLHLRGW